MSNNIGCYLRGEWNPQMHRPPQPFEVGDTVEMMSRDFHMNQGEIAKVDEMKWVGGKNEWCMKIRGSSYRASRFKLVKKGNEQMKTTWAIFLVSHDETGGVIPNMGTGVFVRNSTEADVKNYVTDLIRKNPENEYMFGSIHFTAKLDSPPVKFTIL